MKDDGYDTLKSQIDALTIRVGELENLLDFQPTDDALPDDEGAEITLFHKSDSALTMGPVLSVNSIQALGSRQLRNAYSNRLKAIQMSSFLPLYYLVTNPDVEAAYKKGNINGALDHYVNHGLREGRSPSPFFEPTFYYEAHVDLRRRYRDEVEAGDYRGLVDHWLSHGIGEGRQGSRFFHIKYYLTSHRDLVNYFHEHARDFPTARARHEGAFLHWKRFGNWEGRVTARGNRQLRFGPFIGDFRRGPGKFLQAGPLETAREILEVILLLIGTYEDIKDAIERWLEIRRVEAENEKLRKQLEEYERRVAREYLSSVERGRKELEEFERYRELANMA